MRDGWLPRRTRHRAGEVQRASGGRVFEAEQHTPMTRDECVALGGGAVDRTRRNGTLCGISPERLLAVHEES